MNGIMDTPSVQKLRLLRRREVAELLALSLRQVDRLAAQGDLERVTLGANTIRITLKSVRGFLNK